MSGKVSEKHPDWLDRSVEWSTMRDCKRGEIAVKAEGETYLPMPSGFRALEDLGPKMYQAYLTRAQFPEILRPTLQGMVGVIHRTEAQITMPKAMESLWERATRDGLPLEAFHRRITSELLLTGRYGVMADAASAEAGGSDLPWLAGYNAESIINWSDERDFYVLEESRHVRSGFRWEMKRFYRKLELVEGRYVVQLYEGDEEDGAAFNPTARGRRPLESIPFVVIGPTELSLTPQDPPLMGVARAALAAYRLDADYRHQLYMTGQETLVIVNSDPPDVVGAGVVLTLQATREDHAPDAKYIGPSGTGIAAHRTAILDERDNAASAGARLFDDQRRAAESGDALRIRYAAQTATLTSVAQTSAQGLEQALRHVAVMMGLNPQDVVVKPNLSFVDSTLTPEQGKALMDMWIGGAISYQTLYENLQKGEIASAERSHEEELDLIEEDRLAEDGFDRDLGTTGANPPSPPPQQIPPNTGG